jgi:nucleoside-diphosphate-sugar epimerase/predicted dehydrogenase
LLAEARPDIVHVCTPAGTHFEPARQALLAGAHVYVEKPFVETRAEAEALLRVAEARRRLVSAGHQLLWDPAFRTWARAMAAFRRVSVVDSLFTFHPQQLRLDGAGPSALAAQLVDVLPHPLYTLVAALERVGGEPTIKSITASPTDLHVSLGAGEVTGRLFVSLHARPVASVLTAMSAEGSLSVDFIRSITVGAANPGTTPLEKMVNPLREGWQLQGRTAVSLLRRLVAGAGYVGLADLLREFYGAVASGKSSPLSPAHLLRVTGLHEHLASEVRRAASAHRTRSAVIAQPAAHQPLAVVTGARGFLGKEIVRQLARHSYRVRGVSRSADPDDPNVHEWVATDLSQDVPIKALAGAEVVIHAAAETAGGYDAHQRNTVDATRNLLRAMQLAGVHRLVHVSSISVLRPPKSPWERQNESTPLAPNPERLGAYTWGKCLSERAIAAAERLGIATRIVRPGALIDWNHIELPGLLGRRLYGRWYLGLGRPALPLAVLEVRDAAAAIAWCAEHFDDAPPVVNLMDETIRTRGKLLALFQARGWRGRIVWVPIPLIAGLLFAARTATAIRQFRVQKRLAAWAILRPRRYDSTLGSSILGAAAQARSAVPQAGAPLAVAR